MNSLTTENYIKVRKCDNNMAYILENSSAFLQTEYKVLQYQSSHCFIKCMKLLYNGKIQIYYLTDGYKSLSDMLSKLDAERFITIVSNLFSSVNEVKNNGFLSCSNIDAAFDHIYVEPSTYKVRVVYLPIGKSLYPNDAVFENELRTRLVKVLSRSDFMLSSKVKELSHKLSDGMLSMEDICKGMGAQIKGDKEVPGGILTTHKSILKIIALNAPTRVSIEVDKDSFIIGKNASAVDGVISYNRMISRIHCKVNRCNGNYSLTDLGSANGTYVNGKKQHANVACEIKNGDIVRLADSDFQIVLE